MFESKGSVIHTPHNPNVVAPESNSAAAGEVHPTVAALRRKARYEVGALGRDLRRVSSTPAMHSPPPRKVSGGGTSSSSTQAMSVAMNGTRKVVRVTVPA